MGKKVGWEILTWIYLTFSYLFRVWHLLFLPLQSTYFCSRSRLGHFIHSMQLCSSYLLSGFHSLNVYREIIFIDFRSSFRCFINKSSWTLDRKSFLACQRHSMTLFFSNIKAREWSRALVLYKPKGYLQSSLQRVNDSIFFKT